MLYQCDLSGDNEPSSVCGIYCDDGVHGCPGGQFCKFDVGAAGSCEGCHANCSDPMHGLTAKGKADCQVQCRQMCEVCKFGLIDPARVAGYQCFSDSGSFLGESIMNYTADACSAAGGHWKSYTCDDAESGSHNVPWRRVRRVFVLLAGNCANVWQRRFRQVLCGRSQDVWQHHVRQRRRLPGRQNRRSRRWFWDPCPRPLSNHR